MTDGEKLTEKWCVVMCSLRMICGKTYIVRIRI
jgi:hypothetical protein